MMTQLVRAFDKERLLPFMNVYLELLNIFVKDSIGIHLWIISPPVQPVLVQVVAFCVSFINLYVH